ncbi:MAG TPA: response regulator [Vicinamibacteria bacterium]|nr:response regulator [Vicinamibacteria bacterium]
MSKKKILLVDDSVTSLFMERMTLKHGPYDLVTASDGQQGVERALAERPDLIVMDVVMPRMTGLEALRELRSKPETRGTPVILVTTRGEPANVEAGYESGCTDYLTKPFDPEELLVKVQACLGA